MNTYLELSRRSLDAHRKRTRLTIFSIALSVALVAGIFSMLDVLLDFETTQVIHDFGNYHIAIVNPTDTEMKTVSGRIDVQNSGLWVSFKDGSLNGSPCSIAALDENFSPNMGMKMLSGSYPKAADELMLESWSADKLKVSVGGSVTFSFETGEKKTFRVSGIYSDYGSTKAEGVPGVVVSMEAARGYTGSKKEIFLIEFKQKADMKKAEKEIRSTLGLTDERVGRNERLLAMTGQSDYKAAVGLYQVGGVLFFIVLIAGIVMIYNTFNISVTERTRSFGLLRCVGASKAQIKRLVRKEGFLMLRWALPIGLALGMLATLFCSALLKFLNPIFSEIPLFSFSIVGTCTGLAVGILTVAIATLLPARKASRVSPVSALTGSGDIKRKKAKKRGSLTKIMHAETAMGIGNATAKKKTLILMSASIALSIMMFLGFNVFVNFLHTNLKTTAPDAPDVSITSDTGLSQELYQSLMSLDGTKKVYGRMFDHITATFDATRLTENYKNVLGNTTVGGDGKVISLEKSWLISYDKNRLKWSKPNLSEGNLSEEALNAGNGIIAVNRNTRKGVSYIATDFRVGDIVTLDTVSGKKDFKVMAVLSSIPFGDSDNLNLTTFITTEKIYTEITGNSTLKIIDIQLKSGNQSETINAIKSLAGDSVVFRDARQQNSDQNNAFITLAVFIYGFVAVIALISILNIVSTMNTSVTSKMRYIGVLRAVGMSGGQVDRMVISEAAVYSISGAALGCILGLLLQKWLTENFLNDLRVMWSFPTVEVIGIFIATILITLLSVRGPLKKIKSRGISETIGALQ